MAAEAGVAVAAAACTTAGANLPDDFVWPPGSVAARPLRRDRRRARSRACDDRVMRRALLVTCSCTVGLLAGCGQSSSPSGPGPDATANRAARRLLQPGLSTLPTPGPTHHPANADAVRVIRAWSTALRTGHVKAAAGWFAMPSEFVNGVGPGGTVPAVRLDSLRAAIVANEALPCGAQFVSADQRGRVRQRVVQAHRPQRARAASHRAGAPPGRRRGPTS